MNVLIVDIDKINLDMANHIFKSVIKQTKSKDWIMLPRGMDLLQDMPIEWMKAVRDRLDEKIKELEGGKNAI